MILHFTFPHYYISCNKQRNKFKKVMKEEIKMKNRMKKLLVLATAATMMTAALQDVVQAQTEQTTMQIQAQMKVHQMRT